MCPYITHKDRLFGVEGSNVRAKAQNICSSLCGWGLLVLLRHISVSIIVVLVQLMFEQSYCGECGLYCSEETQSQSRLPGPLALTMVPPLFSNDLRAKVQLLSDRPICWAWAPQLCILTVRGFL